MGSPLLNEWLTGDSREILDLVENEDVLKGFLSLAQEVNDLPDMDIHFYDSPPNLYQVISTGHASTPITPKVTEFFGEPVKIAGKTVPLSLRFDPVMQYVGGIRKDQSLFLKKLKTGSFFCVLWTWPGRSKNTEIRLGWCFLEIQAEDYTRLCRMMENFLLQKNVETLSGIGGTIHGISLPSFLQMSEMEEASYTLRVTSDDRHGSLYLSGGSLIDARYGDTTGSAAAYQIISWENATIQIEAADPDRIRKIHDPLMYIMMESMKIKDEGGAEVPLPPPAAPVPESPPDAHAAPESDQAKPQPSAPSITSDQDADDSAEAPALSPLVTALEVAPHDGASVEAPDQVDLPPDPDAPTSGGGPEDANLSPLGTTLEIVPHDGASVEAPDQVEPPPKVAPVGSGQDNGFSDGNPEETDPASRDTLFDAAPRDDLFVEAPDDATLLSSPAPTGADDNGGLSENVDLSSLVAAMTFDDDENVSAEKQEQDAPFGPLDPPPLFDGATFSPLSVDTLEAMSDHTEAPVSDDSWMPPPDPGQQAKKKRSGMRPMIKWLIGVAGAIVLAAVVIGGLMIVKERQAEDRYNRLMTDLAITKALDAKIVLLSTYLQDYPNDSRRPMLEARIKAITREMEDAAYNTMVAEVAALPLDEQYENKALSLYTAFLTQYPKTRYIDAIDAAKAGLRPMMEKFYFAMLEKAAGGDSTDFVEQYRNCRRYLDRFSESKYRKEVEQMMKALSRKYADVLKKQAAACEKKETWDTCIADTDQYLTYLADTPEAEQIQKLHTSMVDKKAYAELAAKASAISSDWARALKLYQDYLAQHPDTTQRAAIERQILALDRQAQHLDKWKKASAYAKNKDRMVEDRIKYIEAYLGSAPEPYASQARALRKQLGEEHKRVLAVRKKKEAEDEERRRRQAYLEELERQRIRVARLQEEVSHKLKRMSSRFRDNGNGTVTDLRTGLTWTLLDSTMELERGGKMDHRSAQAYVATLSTGGYSWRLPTANELASLYKNEPFFPSTGAGWYWTSETFVKGFSYVVDVVTTQRETVFKRLSMDEQELGAVRAVRR